MNKITNLKDNLVFALPFDDVWMNRDESGEPVAEFGYVRADHDGYRWWNTWWPKHEALRTPELVAEGNALYDAFRDAFPTLSAMTSWCLKERGVYDDEFNAYYVGNHGCYWLRMITRRGDYNLYLHIYSKAAMAKKEG